MAEDEASLYLLIVVAVVAVVGLGLAVASFVTHESVGGMMGGSGGGGMMGGQPTTGGSSSPGVVEWAILIVSAAFFALALVLLLLRGRVSREPGARGPDSVTDRQSAPVPAPALVEVPDHAAGVAAGAPAAPAAAGAVPEPTLVKLLNDDERRMYLELRDHGGQMYQRDLVALGIFSKAKVTRVLDKLEAKGLLVREAHGMTNRVRLVQLPAK